MAHKAGRSSLESGIGSSESSSLEYYFNEFIPKLGRELKRIGNPMNGVNSTEEGVMAVCGPSPVKIRNSQQSILAEQQTQQKQQVRQLKQQTSVSRTSLNTTYNAPKENSETKRSSVSSVRKQVACVQDSRNNSQQINESNSAVGEMSTHELANLVEVLRANNLYSQKLIKIMLDGLEKDLGPEFFKLFVTSGLPPFWFPIVKFNEKNTPYINILIFSAESDDPPYTAEYSDHHEALSRFVLDCLRKNASAKQATTSRQQLQTSKQQHFPASEQKQRQQQQPIARKDTRASWPAAPMCSTPLANKKPPNGNRTWQPVALVPSDDMFNDSKRVQPIRSCKRRK